MTKVVLNDTVQATDGRVAVLLGGNSAEREVSLRSGAAVADALAAQGLAVTKIDTAGDGWMSELAAFSHCFLALHGPGGEDGTVQGALECLGVRYTGSGVMPLRWQWTSCAANYCGWAAGLARRSLWNWTSAAIGRRSPTSWVRPL